MRKILILYYSGVGNTRMVAENFYGVLERDEEVSIFSIEKMPENIAIEEYHALIIGFPTIHSAPPKPIMEFIKNIKTNTSPIPTFVFTTCGLYPANTLRIFSKECIKKNFIPMLHRSYRCAATDGILLAPFMKVWFKHEKGIQEKIKRDSLCFRGLLNKEIVPILPRLKWYSIFNLPNKIIGQHFSPNIYIHKEKCIKCQKCIQDCPVKCYLEEKEGYPVFRRKYCIHCYRCIHHCPKRAISLSKRYTPSKTLYRE